MITNKKTIIRDNDGFLLHPKEPKGYFFVVSTDTLVVSTIFFVVSTIALLVESTVEVDVVVPFEQDANKHVATKIVNIAFIILIVLQFKKFKIMSKKQSKNA